MQLGIALIGGSSSVGKSTAATALVERFGFSVVATDEILANEPGLQPLSEGLEPWNKSAPELCALLVAAARAASPYLQKTAEDSVAKGRHTIIEGERFHPALVGRLMERRLAAGVFIVEENAQRLYDTLMSRSRRFVLLPEPVRRKVAELDRLYGCWCQEECRRLRVPVVASQPWHELAQRVASATGVR